MTIKTSLVRMNDEDEEHWLTRLARVEAKRWMADLELINAMLRRGVAGHVPYCQSLSERDGN